MCLCVVLFCSFSILNMLGIAQGTNINYAGCRIATAGVTHEYKNYLWCFHTKINIYTLPSNRISRVLKIVLTFIFTIKYKYTYVQSTFLKKYSNALKSNRNAKKFSKKRSKSYNAIRNMCLPLVVLFHYYEYNFINCHI